MGHYSAQRAVAGSEAVEGFLYTAAGQIKQANRSFALLPNGGLHDRFSTAERKEGRKEYMFRYMYMYTVYITIYTLVAVVYVYV